MKIIILIISSFCIINTFSQIQAKASFGKSQIGWNYRIGIEYFPIKQFSIGLGTRIIHKTGTPNYSFNVYKDKFYPQKTKEYFGIYINLNYYILKNNDYFLQPFFSYDFSYSKSSLKWNLFRQMADQNGAPINQYKLEEVYFNPLDAFEHHISFGLDVKIFEGLKLSQNIGIGIAHFAGYDYNQANILLIGSIDQTYEFSWLYFNIGLKYDFRKLIEKRKEKAPNKNYK